MECTQITRFRGLCIGRLGKGNQFGSREEGLEENGHALLNHAHRVQKEYDRTTNFCLNLAVEHEKEVAEKWLPELKNAVLNAQKCLDDCKYVRGLLDEWWKQPASTVVDWVAVDGENVAAWQNVMNIT